jgi:hypothetical protein
VCEEHVCFRLKRVDARPGWLLASLAERRELLDFGAFRLLRGVTDHAGVYVGDGRMRRLVCMRMAEGTIKLRPIFFRDVLPVVELDGLARRFRLSWRSQQKKARDENGYDQDCYGFSQPSHLISEWMLGRISLKITGRSQLIELLV